MKNSRSLWQSSYYISEEPTSMKPNEVVPHTEEPESDAVERNSLLPDFSDIDEVRKAFVMSELINRKY